MTKFKELSRQQFLQYKKIRTINSALYGEYHLFTNKNTKNKYIVKSLSQQFTSTRNTILYYQNENQNLFFFQCQGESLDCLLQAKYNLLNDNNSKDKNGEICCWLNRFKNSEELLSAIIKFSLMLYGKGINQFILSCFRIVNKKLVYYYESWYNKSEEIVKSNFNQLQNYYFSPEILKQIQNNQQIIKSKKSSLFIISLLVLHLGTKDLNLRLYEFNQYKLNIDNLNNRLEIFKKRFPKLYLKIYPILNEKNYLSKIDEDYSSINYSLKNKENESCIFEDSFQSKLNNSNLNYSFIFENSHSKSNITKSKIIQAQVSQFNLIQIVKKKNFQNISNISLIEYLEITEYMPLSIYQQNILKLFEEIILKPKYKKKIYSDNSIYIGEFKNQQRSGQGLYIFESGHVYYGSFNENDINGIGKYLFKSGQIYEGETLNGQRHGHGKYCYINQLIYEGSWHQNERKGLGILNFENGKKFIGTFNGNEKDAQGIYIETDGSIHEGVFLYEQFYSIKKPFQNSRILINENLENQNTLRNVEICQKDGIYKGEILFGVKNGYGSFKTPKYTYEGFWKDNKMHGKGIIKYDNISIHAKWCEGFIVEYLNS